MMADGRRTKIKDTQYEKWLSISQRCLNILESQYCEGIQDQQGLPYLGKLAFDDICDEGEDKDDDCKAST
jgi:hypothetical protein